MGSFISGFADGFSVAHNKKADRDAEKENQMFKYQMDALVDKKTLRDKQKLKEGEWSQQAKLAAERIGDPSFASEAYNQLSSGRTIESVYSDIDSGNYKRDPNAKGVPTTVQLTNMPDGVSSKAQADPLGTGSADTTEVASNDKGIVGGLIQKGKNAVGNLTGTRTAQDRVNDRMDELDPNLRQQELQSNTNYSPIANTGWQFHKNNEVKLIPLGEAYQARENARQSGDKAAERKAEQAININKMVMADKASANAKAQGKNVSTYMPINEDGTVGPTFAAERTVDADGNPVLMNTSDDPDNPKAVTGKYIEVNDEANKQYISLAKDFGKRNADLDTAAAQYTSALETTAKIDQIIKRNPAVTTMGADITKWVNSWQDEVKGAYTILQNQQGQLNDLMKDQSPEGVAKFEKALAGYEAQAQNFLSKPNTDLAYDKATYDTLRTLAAYKFAAANGISGHGQSDKDVQNFYKATGGDGNPITVKRALYNNASAVLTSLDSSRISLENDQAVKTFEKTYLKGHKSGLVPMRMEDRINKLPNGQEILPLFKTIAAGGDYRLAAEADPVEEPKAPTGNRQGKPMTNPVQQNATPSVPADAAEYLKKNPNLRDKFDAKYGAGASKQILGE